jgi:tRNA1Val (adenine37-N6)-methyltransferase
MGEQIDDLHRNGLRIIQNKKLFCFGQDAVLLSAFAYAKKGDRVLDLGCGNGIIPILMSARNSGATYEGLEIQPDSAELAKRSVKLNNLENINITVGDLKRSDEYYSCGTFDAVTVNPPYMNEKGGIVNPSDNLAIARHETKCTLDDVVCAAGKMLKFGGKFFMIHRPSRLADICCIMRAHSIEPKRIRFVHSKADKEPVMVLIEGRLGGKPLLKIMPFLIVYDENGNYTKEVMDIYYG